MTDVATVPSEAELIEKLGALATCAGSPRLAKRALAARGIAVEESWLKEMRELHAGMYQALAVEQARAAEDAIAQEYRELARVSQRVTRTFLDDLDDQLAEKGIEGIDYDLKRQLPQTVQALAKIMQTSTDKLITITGRDQERGGSDVGEALRDLAKLGIIKLPEAPIDSTAVEVPA